jgi:hypothetical protein
VYRYGKRPGKWSQILPDTSDVHAIESKEDEGIVVVEEPQPRYAHQVVYEEGSKTVFLHGGNAGMGSGGEEGMERAGDLVDREEKAEEDGEKAGDGKDSYGQKERRLDDFWSMTLDR